MRKILAIFLAATALFMTGCGGEDEKAPVKFKEFAPGEEVTLKSVEGKELTLVRKDSGFVIKGEEEKIVMIDIFGTFCPPCQKEAPELTEYQVKNGDKFMLIGLTHFEEVTDAYVLNDFIKKYHAYYFITNDQKINDRLSDQIAQDIEYKRELSLPFKVVLKDGIYQTLTDVDSGRFGVKYYLGGINLPQMKSDLQKIGASAAQ